MYRAFTVSDIHSLFEIHRATHNKATKIKRSKRRSQLTSSEPAATGEMLEMNKKEAALAEFFASLSTRMAAMCLSTPSNDPSLPAPSHDDYQQRKDCLNRRKGGSLARSVASVKDFLLCSPLNSSMACSGLPVVEPSCANVEEEQQQLQQEEKENENRNCGSSSGLSPSAKFLISLSAHYGSKFLSLVRHLKPKRQGRQTPPGLPPLHWCHRRWCKKCGCFLIPGATAAVHWRKANNDNDSGDGDGWRRGKSELICVNCQQNSQLLSSSSKRKGKEGKAPAGSRTSQRHRRKRPKTKKRCRAAGEEGEEEGVLPLKKKMKDTSQPLPVVVAPTTIEQENNGNCEQSNKQPLEPKKKQKEKGASHKKGKEKNPPPPPAAKKGPPPPKTSFGSALESLGLF